MNNSNNQSPSVFHFEESADIRAIVKDGEPWFVAKDVCDVLGLSNTTEALRALDEDEKTTLRNSEGRAGAGAQCFNIINESGLYALVIRSNKPNARKFRKWITSEVLPAIRKTGRYVGPGTNGTDLTDRTDAGKVAAAGVPWFKAEGTYYGVPVMSQTTLADRIGVNVHTIRALNTPKNNPIGLKSRIDIFRVRRGSIPAGVSTLPLKFGCSRVNLLTESGVDKICRWLRMNTSLAVRADGAPAPVPVPVPVPAPVPAPSAVSCGVSKARLDALLRINLPLRCSDAKPMHRYTVDECLSNDAAFDAIEELRRAGFNVSEAYTVLAMTREIAVRYRDMLKSVRNVGGVIDQMLGAVGYCNGDEVSMCTYDRTRKQA